MGRGNDYMELLSFFFTDIEVPYPSIADAVFILSWPLWTYGLLQIYKVAGIKYALRDRKGKIALIVIPLLIIAASYYLLFQVARGGQISWDNSLVKLFFDLFYPIGDVVILTLVVLIYTLSRNFLGGMYKKPIIWLLGGFTLNYASDLIFSFTTTNETYFNGHVVDFLFITTMFVLSLGLSFLSTQTHKDEGIYTT